jgi:hypothetical protein
MQTAGLLRNVPVLAGLSDDLLERLGGEIAEVQVRAARSQRDRRSRSWPDRSARTGRSLELEPAERRAECVCAPQ